MNVIAKTCQCPKPKDSPEILSTGLSTLVPAHEREDTHTDTQRGLGPQMTRMGARKTVRDFFRGEARNAMLGGCQWINKVLRPFKLA